MIGGVQVLLSGGAGDIGNTPLTLDSFDIWMKLCRVMPPSFLRLCQPVRGATAERKGGLGQSAAVRTALNRTAAPAAAAPGRAKYTEYKSKICAMGVFRSQTPRACERSPVPAICSLTLLSL